MNVSNKQPKPASGPAMLALWMWAAFLGGGLAVLFGFLPFDTVRIVMLGIILAIALGASLVEERRVKA